MTTLPSGHANFTGAVDEVAVYDRVLDPARIKAHYDAGKR